MAQLPTKCSVTQQGSAEQEEMADWKLFLTHIRWLALAAASQLPTSHMGTISSSSFSAQVQLLAHCAQESWGRSVCAPALACAPHPGEKPRRSSWLLSTAWPSPGVAVIWGVNQWMEDMTPHTATGNSAVGKWERPSENAE